MTGEAPVHLRDVACPHCGGPLLLLPSRRLQPGPLLRGLVHFGDGEQCRDCGEIQLVAPRFVVAYEPLLDHLAAPVPALIRAEVARVLARWREEQAALGSLLAASDQVERLWEEMEG